MWLASFHHNNPFIQASSMPDVPGGPNIGRQAAQILNLRSRMVTHNRCEAAGKDWQLRQNCISHGKKDTILYG
jgi:hypothetical protein